jgi:hypothetical protein
LRVSCPWNIVRGGSVLDYGFWQLYAKTIEDQRARESYAPSYQCDALPLPYREKWEDLTPDFPGGGFDRIHALLEI